MPIKIHVPECPYRSYGQDDMVYCLQDLEIRGGDIEPCMYCNAEVEEEDAE